MHKNNNGRFLLLGILVLGLSTANAGNKSTRGLYEMAQSVASKIGGVASNIGGFATEYMDTAHVDCENCVHIKGLPGCVQSSIVEATRPNVDADMCLLLKVGFKMSQYLPEIPGEVRMGIRAPLYSPLRLFRYDIMGVCKDIPIVAQYLASTIGSPNMKIHEICGCDTYMCNKYVGLFGTHPVFQI